jgi:hypothetical protein
MTCVRSTLSFFGCNFFNFFFTVNFVVTLKQINVEAQYDVVEVKCVSTQISNFGT